MNYLKRRSYRVTGRNPDVIITSEQYERAVELLHRDAFFWTIVDFGDKDKPIKLNVYLFETGPSIVHYREDIKAVEIEARGNGALELAASKLELPL